MPFLNRCIWNATSTGTGSFVAASAAQNGYLPSGCLDPTVIDGATYHYFAIDPITGAHEEGDGVWTVATSTLTRATIRNSSNSGSVVSFANVPVVYMGGPISTDLSILNFGSSDTGLSKTGAGVVALGNGTAGDTSGTIQTAVVQIGADITLSRAAAGEAIQASGTQSQSYVVANTYTSAGANYEVAYLGWASNVFQMGTYNVGTGVARPFGFVFGGSFVGDYGKTTANAWTLNGPVKITGTLTLPAGTTTLSPLVMPSGTLNTTAVVGAFEFDGVAWYLTSVGSSRQIVLTDQFQVLSSNRTLVSNTSAQAIFNATTNGAITLAGSTTYEFEAVINVTGLSASSKTLSLGFALGGSASLTSIQYFVQIFNSAGAIVGGFVTTAAASALISASTSTIASVLIKGIIRMNVGGTVTPQLTQTATTAAAVVNANSFIKFRPLGSNTVTNVGDWS